MRSFVSVAGLLAAAGSAVAVPQQYTGWYPMPNSTHTTTGPYGTGAYPPFTLHPTDKPTTSTTTSTRTSTSTNTHYVTISPSSGSGSSPGGHQGGNSVETEVIGTSTSVLAAETACGSGGSKQTVTITEKVRETITITEGVQQETSYSTTYSHVSLQHSDFHSQATHTPSGPAFTPITKPWGAPNGTTSHYPIGTGTGLPSYTWSPTWTPPTGTPSHSTYVPPPPSSTYTPSTTSSIPSSTSSTSSTASPTSTATPGTGKRGLSYNDASMTHAFEGHDEVSWAYNWGQTAGDLPQSFQFVPMLWGNSEDFTSTWDANVADAISNGCNEVFAFNEPDLASQSNMDTTTAAQAFKDYLSPLAGKVRIGSPSVTNGAAPMGISWLTDFMSQCSDCPIDFVTIHWYDSASNAQYFKDHVQEAHDKTGKPVWVTEFGASGSDEEISAFLEDVMAWMDEQDFVERYAYFMAQEGLLNSGSSLSSYGVTYAGN